MESAPVSQFLKLCSVTILAWLIRKMARQMVSLATQYGMEMDRVSEKSKSSLPKRAVKNGYIVQKVIKESLLYHLLTERACHQCHQCLCLSG